MCHKCGRGVPLGVKARKFKGKTGFDYTLPDNVLYRCSHCRTYTVDIETRDHILETARTGLKEMFEDKGIDELAARLMILTTIEEYQEFFERIEGSFGDIA
jgi:hypothetical protein